MKNNTNDTPYKLVTFAANELEKAGIQPTIERVKARVEQDMSEKEVAKYLQQWKEEQLLLRTRAIDASPQGIFIIDAAQKDLPIIYMNPAFQKITGYRANESLSCKQVFLKNQDANKPEVRKMFLAIKEQRTEKATIKCYRKDGTTVWNEFHLAPVPNFKDKNQYYIGIITDISEHKKIETQLEQLATYDDLTGLPNRTLLTDRLKQAILYAHRNNKQLALLFLDIDRFKVVNDSLGQGVGNVLLKEVANRLVDLVEEGDSVARLGDDEFAIILNSIKNESEVITKVSKILIEISKPFHIHKYDINITASLGVCFYPKDGRDVESLLKNADLSMIKAKEQGRNNFQFYTSSLNRKVMRRLIIENLLYSAIEKNEFHLAYQPVLNTKTSEIIGFEALLRWNNPLLGDVSPEEFIPIAEDNGFILDIGKWVLEHTCKLGYDLKKKGYPPFLFSMNVSVRELKHEGFTQAIENIFQKYEILPQQLQLEITEKIMIEDRDKILDKMHRLKNIGVSIAIDDFGKEYSSLNYLIHFPVDSIKIDLAFTHALLVNGKGQTIVKAILSLGQSLGLNVIAEGVEYRKQYDFYKQHHCDMIQGFYIAKPMSQSDIERFLNSRSAHSPFKKHARKRK